jgi:hypothetical protein
VSDARADPGILNGGQFDGQKILTTFFCSLFTPESTFLLSLWNGAAFLLHLFTYIRPTGLQWAPVPAPLPVLASHGGHRLHPLAAPLYARGPVTITLNITLKQGRRQRFLEALVYDFHRVFQPLKLAMCAITYITFTN